MCVNLLWCLQQLLRIGVNLKNFPTSAVPATFALLFHLGIAAVLLLYVLFWLKVCLTLCFHLPSSGLQLQVSKSLLLLPNNLISLVWFEDTPSESLESNDLIPFIVSYMLLCVFLFLSCTVGSVYYIEDSLLLGYFLDVCGTQDPFPPCLNICQIEICLKVKEVSFSQ